MKTSSLTVVSEPGDYSPRILRVDNPDPVSLGPQLRNEGGLLSVSESALQQHMVTAEREKGRNS